MSNANSAEHATNRTRATQGSGRPRSSQVTKEAILEAAFVEFAKLGYEGTTTAAIARHVGVTQPLIHYHFGSKDELWSQTLDISFSRLASRLKDSSTPVEGPESFEGLARGYVEFVTNNPEFGRMVARESDPARIRWMVDRYIRPLTAMMEERLEEARSAGLLADIPTRHILSAFLGAANHPFTMSSIVEELYDIDPRESGEAHSYATSIWKIISGGVVANND